MPVPILGLKVRSDNQKVKFLTIFGRPKTGIFRRFRGVPVGPSPGGPELWGSGEPSGALEDPQETRGYP